MTHVELESAVGEILIEADAIQSRIGELGAEISSDYAGRDLLLVGVLKGAVFFMMSRSEIETSPAVLGRVRCRGPRRPGRLPRR